MMLHRKFGEKGTVGASQCHRETVGQAVQTREKLDDWTCSVAAEICVAWLAACMEID